MAELRLRAIAESDRRWPNYGDSRSHSLSGGFLDGALWADQTPQGDLEAELNRRFPNLPDPIEQIVNGRWRQGFWLGAAWVMEERSQQSADSSAAQPSQNLPTIYLGTIFDPSLAEGSIECVAIVHSDLEVLKKAVEAAVWEINVKVLASSLNFSWDTSGLIYYPQGDPGYGYFAWAQVQEATPGVPLRVIEFLR